MAGLLEEGNEVMEEGEDEGRRRRRPGPDRRGSKVEHYEISAYGTARTLAGQAGLPDVAALLNKTLAEEEIADNLLTQIARELMSEARTGMTKAPKHAGSRAVADGE